MNSKSCKIYAWEANNSVNIDEFNRLKSEVIANINLITTLNLPARKKPPDISLSKKDNNVISFFYHERKEKRRKQTPPSYKINESISVTRFRSANRFGSLDSLSDPEEFKSFNIDHNSIQAATF